MDKKKAGRVHRTSTRTRPRASREKIVNSRAFIRLFEKARARMADPKRKTCAHGHQISAANADVSHVRRTGLYGCHQCNQAVQARYAANKAKGTPKKVRLGIPEDPETALKVVVRTADVQYARLKPQARTPWKRRLLGMLATSLGVQDIAKLTPVAVPDGFAQKRAA